MAYVLGLLLGLIARLWISSLRVRVISHSSLEKKNEEPRVMCFWHGTQFPILAAKRRRRTAALVSFSRDGQMQSVALKMQGLFVVRGSSSRGGAGGLRALVRMMRARGWDAAFAVDGPRGPLRKVKMGAIYAAKMAGSRIVPIGVAIASGHVFRKAWDQFLLPWPFTKVVVVFGEAMSWNETDVLQKLEHALDASNALAKRELNRLPENAEEART